MVCSFNHPLHRYDITQYLADRYKWLTKFIFILQLLVSWAIVVVSTLYVSWDGRCADDCAEGEDCAGWIIDDSSAIIAMGETVFILTVGASFLISFDSYINAKARTCALCPTLPLIKPDSLESTLP